MIRTGLLATCAALLAMAGIMAWAYGHLPVSGSIPIHFAGDGHADGWAPTAAMRLAICLSSWAWPCFWASSSRPYPIWRRGRAALRDPGQRFSLSGSAAPPCSLITAVVALKMVHGASGVFPAAFVADAWRWIGVAVSVLFIAIGNVLPKTRPNFFLGIRTPWTLSSPSTWEKSRRFGGLLLVLAGIAGLVGAFVFSGRWAVYFSVAAMLSAAVIAAAYSFFVWRSATDKGQSPNYLP